jgi:hypothetical protein
VSSTIETLTDMLTDAIIQRFRRGQAPSLQTIFPSLSRCCCYTSAPSLPRSRFLAAASSVRMRGALIAQTIVKVSVRVSVPCLDRMPEEQAAHHHDRWVLTRTNHPNLGAVQNVSQRRRG